MKISVGVGELGGSGAGFDGFVAGVREAAARGFSTAWAPQIFGFDALTALAVAGAAVPGIDLGTAVIPTYPRHPTALAAQALTVQAATGGRLTLGIGLSHQIVIEQMFGYSFEKPARHMREYLSVLGPLLRGEAVSFKGEVFNVNATITVPGATAPSVVVAALGPLMLRITGELADGTITWMTGPATIADHTVPAITKAAGSRTPRVIVGLPVSVTADAGAAREAAAKSFSVYGFLPSYRAMLDREGAAGPADVAIVGDESEVVAAVQRLADAGATEFLAVPFGSADDIARTMDVLSAIR